MLALGAAGPLRAAECPVFDHAAKVDLRLEEGEIRYDYGRDRNFLAELRRGDGAAAAGQHVPIGLTITRLELKIKTEVDIARAAGGGFCPYLRSATIEFGFPNFEVFVERKYGKGSCEHDAILDHEMEHVRINRTALANNRYLIEGRISDVRKTPLPPQHTPDQARGLFTKALHEALQPALELVKQQAGQRHRILDTPESYAKTYARCRNW